MLIRLGGRFGRCITVCVFCMPLAVCAAELDDSPTQSATPIEASLGCLFFDDFISTTLDTEKWIISQNVTIDSGSIAPPSAPYAMRLDSNDFVISHVMDLSGFIGAELHYALERRSNFSGAALVFDYTTAADGWAELARHTISTPVSNSFQSFVVYLPASALHENFHLRIRHGASFGDTWYLDDFCVMETFVQPPIATSADASTTIHVPITIALQGIDPNFDAITYLITSLPGNGTLSDPQAGPILTVPYTLAGGGNTVLYTPGTDFTGIDTFQFKVNDGQSPPDGGDSNIATITVEVVDCRPHPAITPSPVDAMVNSSSNPLLTWQDPDVPDAFPDFCASAQTLFGTSPIFLMVSGTDTATTSPDDPFMGCGGFSNTLWYRITPDANGIMNINTCGSNYDTVVAVWTGNCSNLTWLGCDDDSECGLASNLNVEVQAGITYLIEVADFGSPGGGNLVLNITGVNTFCAPIYTVLVDTVNPPTTPVCQNQAARTCDPGAAVRSGTTYYWRVKSDNCCGPTLGPVWSFTTDTPADFDHDGDVDQSDFSHLQLCLNGAGVPQNDPACLDARLDLNDTVDAFDFAVFLQCANGPNFLPPPSCSD